MDSLEFIKALQISYLASLSSALIRRTHFILQTIFQWKTKCIQRERNKVADRLANVASDRNIEVQVFVNFPEEMLDEFGFHKVVEFPAIIPKFNVSPQMPSSQLVENLCNGKAIKNRRFCQKALSTPKVIAAMDTTQLGTLIMKLGVANAKAMLNVYNEIIKKLGSPQALKALNCCVEAYKYAIFSFEMVSSELVEDSQ
ncbi:hypothetical protein Goshw_017349, partial [Gossypium schwendimanii]|nr:hypothetical protein [Gossypium schwendimanii]